jgi:hypothetical protein
MRLKPIWIRLPTSAKGASALSDVKQKGKWWGPKICQLSSQTSKTESEFTGHDGACL